MKVNRPFYRLTHFRPIFRFYNLWKQQKIKCFVMSWGGLRRHIGIKISNRFFWSLNKYNFLSMELFLLINKPFCRFKDRFFLLTKINKNVIITVFINIVFMAHKTNFSNIQFFQNKFSNNKCWCSELFNSNSDQILCTIFEHQFSVLVNALFQYLEAVVQRCSVKKVFWKISQNS